MYNRAGAKSKALLKLIIFVSTVITVILAMQAGAYAITLAAVPETTSSDTQIRLNWTAAPGAVAYAIFRDGNMDSPVKTTDINQISYLECIDDYLTPNTSYSYVVRAYSDYGMTGILQQSSAVSAKTTPMVKPIITHYEYNIATGAVLLTWQNTSNAARGSIIRRTDNHKVIVQIDARDTQAVFYDPDLKTSSVRYEIVSTDLNAAPNEHHSDPSAPITVVPVTPPALTATMTNGTVTVSWGSLSSQASQFQLERSSYSSGAWDDWQIVNRSLSGSSATNTPVSPGMYRYRLVAKPLSNYSGSFMSGSVVKPAVPGNLRGILVNDYQVELSWDIDAMNYANLQVERRAGSQAYSVIEELAPGVHGYTDYVDLAANTTYSYRITAYVSANNKASSNEISISTSVPAAPTNLSVMVKNDPSSHVLTWNDNSNSETGFIIERSENGGGFSLLYTVGANIKTYTVVGNIQNDSSYAYRVAAFNPFGTSKYSNEVKIGTSTTINIPNSLSLKAISSSQIDLTWTYAGNGSYSSVVERKTGWDGDWSVVATVPAGKYKYSDLALSPDTQYFYRVRCRLESGLVSDSFPSGDNGKGVSTMLGGLRLTGKADSDNRIYLSWTGNSAGGNVTIERKMANGGFAVLATVDSSARGWYDETGLVPEAVYTYRIKAKTTSNESVYSNEVAVSNFYLEAPSDLTAVANSTAGIDLSWKDNSNDETGFEIWRQVEGADDFTLYATVGENITTYTDKNATSKGIEYYYRVRAYISDPELYSDYTDTAGRGTGVIAAPTNLKFTYDSETKGVLTWKDNSSNESGFVVERKIGEDGGWNDYEWLSSNETSCTIEGLNQYSIYYFRVRAYRNYGGFEVLSDVLAVSTALPEAPTDITATAVSANQINVRWTDNANNESGYRIMRTTATQGYYSVVGEVDAGVTSYADRGLYPNVTYTYKVAVFNGGGLVEGGEATATTGKKVTFTDIGAYAWARDGIENLASRGVIKGKDTGKFAPGDTLTKAEFVSMMLRAFRLETTPVGSFADVKPGKWYYKDIMMAAYFGIISVDGNNRFYPENPITREEIALIIAKTLEVAGKPLDGYENSVLEKFSDKNQISPYAVASMASLVGEGVLTGVSGNAIAPRNTATRAEAAVFIYRIIDR